MELEFQKKKFLSPRSLDVPKIEFQNKDISLINFRHGAFYWKVCKKWIKVYLGLIFHLVTIR